MIGQLDDPARQYGPQAQPLTILGGDCAVDQLLKFLTAWQLPKADMPWCLWEEASRIVLEEKTLPDAPEHLERGRVFGPAGDLSLRRNGPSFRWWFIGPAGIAAPQTYGQVHDFWADAQRHKLILHRHDEKALLWGKWAGKGADGRDVWREDRVAGAQLNYPGLIGPPERVQVRFYRFTTAGRVAFVWLQGLEGYDG